MSELRDEVEPRRRDDHLDLAAVGDIIGVVEDKVVERHVVNREGDVALRLPGDRFLEVFEGHLGELQVARDGEPVGDGGDHRALAHPCRLEEGLQLALKGCFVEDAVVVDDAGGHGAHAEVLQRRGGAGAQRNDFERARTDLEADGEVAPGQEASKRDASGAGRGRDHSAPPPRGTGRL